MADERVKQRLAAILAADVAGYTRLMADDERATIATLGDYRARFRAHIVSHGGRVVDMAGDSILAVFDSAAGALASAVDVQGELTNLNSALPEARRMQFRIGVNTGDIQEAADGTVYGDGVNIAARLESLAAPGGVMLSESAHLQVRRTPNVAFVDAGTHEVKNIDEPVRAYRVLLNGEQTPVPAIKPESARRKLVVLAGSLALIIAVAGFGVWRSTFSEKPETVGQEGGTDQQRADIAAMPTGPSIAVLPFSNLSGDPEQAYFADGIVEDILTRLSRFSDLRVIGRNSTFQYKGQAVDPRVVGQELGAAYVLEGSLRRSADRIKITVQLLDASDGSHVWANDYERDLSASQVFEIQAEIAASVAGKLGGGYGEIAQESRRLEGYVPPNNLSSYECILRMYEYWTIFTAEKHEEVRDCLEFTVEAEPTYAEAWAGLTWMFADESRFGYNTLPNSMQRSLDAGLKALSLDPDNVMAHWTLAVTYFNLLELDPFFTYADRALELNPNDPITLAALGEKMIFAGFFDRGLPLMEKAASLNPNHPKWYYYSLSYAAYQKRDYETAADFAEKADLPGFYWTWVYRTASYGQTGASEKARAAARELSRIHPEFADTWAEEMRMWNFPDDMANHLAEGFEKAGLFDEAEPPSRPVIAVLPFDNLSEVPGQEYFADGITEDMISQLSRFQEVGVIARNSTFQYRGQASDVRKIGVELNASHIVEGSIRRMSDRIRVTVQLVDASDGNHLWSENYDRDLSAADIFDIQDDIATRVATTIADNQGIISRSSSEVLRRTRPEILNSYECTLRHHEYNRVITPEAHAVAQSCMQETVKADPNYAEAWAYLAELYTDGYGLGFPTVDDPLVEALAAAEQALKMDPLSQQSRFALGLVYFHMRDRERFISNALIAHELNPNNAYITGTVGWGLMLADDWERGQAFIEQAIELSPYHPGWWHYPTLIYAYMQEDYRAALVEAEKLQLPGFFWTPAMYAAIHGKMGSETEAEMAVARLLELNPDFANRPRFYIGAFVFSGDVVEQIMDGLRAAGMHIPPKSE